MKKFSDFGITLDEDKTIFNCQQISIADIINCEIEVLDYEKGVKTAHGDDRYIVKIRHEGIECKFFTNAGKLKKMLDLVPKEEFPFLATIKQQKYGSGNNKSYYFI